MVKKLRRKKNIETNKNKLHHFGEEEENEKMFVENLFYRILSVRERGDEYSFDKPFRCFR